MPSLLSPPRSNIIPVGVGRISARTRREWYCTCSEFRGETNRSLRCSRNFIKCYKIDEWRAKILLNCTRKLISMENGVIKYFIMRIWFILQKILRWVYQDFTILYLKIIRFATCNRSEIVFQRQYREFCYKQAFFSYFDWALLLSSATAGKLPKYYSCTRFLHLFSPDIIKGSVTLHYQTSERTVKAWDTKAILCGGYCSLDSKRSKGKEEKRRISFFRRNSATWTNERE